MLDRPTHLTLFEKLGQTRWSLLFLLTLIASIGVAMLYSAAGGSFEPWAIRQAVRYGSAIVLLLVVALIDLRVWLGWSYTVYAVALVLLAIVDLVGVVGMGAQRWLDLGVITLQPSEIMKIALILALARYFHGVAPDRIGRLVVLIPPALITLAPVALVLKQPDLGTAAMLLATGVGVFFAAGVPLWMFAAAGAAGAACLPIAWGFLHDYQRQRVLTFLDPASDPLGSGYHILQSKIALGSGGVFGKGYLEGSQSHLNFLPEKQTDFIFTMLAEEFGMVGSLVLVGLYAAVILYCLAIALSCKNQFGRLLAFGLTFMFFLYLFINMAMVMGLLPVVGVPLPLVSYGGTAAMSLMIGFGLIMCAWIHRNLAISRHSIGEGA